MSSVTALTPFEDEDFVLEGFLALRAPEGYKAELIDGEIVVTPPPDGDHEDIVGTIVWQIARSSASELSYAPNKGLILPCMNAKGRDQRVIPDATFALKEKRLFHGAEPWMPAQGVDLVLEVTSSKPERDRETKRRCYAEAGIPLYLLVDRQHQTVSLFSGPRNDDYSEAAWVPVGKSLALPKPLDFELDTAQFI